MKINIGNTDLIYKDGLYYKLEYNNPTGSIKDRPAYNILYEYINKGILKKGDTIVEATSGNMGISLAYFGAHFGINVVIVIPDNVSVERVKLLEKYGAKVILKHSLIECIEEVNYLVKKEKYIPINQFENIYNYLAYLKMGKEIFEKLEYVDYIICGIGTAGTIRGLSEYIKNNNLKTKIIGVEPDESAVISKGLTGVHNIQGIGAGFIPPLLDLNKIDLIETVKTSDVLSDFKKNNSLGLGLSGIACKIVGLKILEKEKDAKIVVIVADGITRYESMIK
ncbi:MAG: cysteine synthase family protein [Bacilli bacterium]|nr:cysteine synthase family protein [Bacilli bacterium]